MDGVGRPIGDITDRSVLPGGILSGTAPPGIPLRTGVGVIGFACAGVGRIGVGAAELVANGVASVDASAGANAGVERKDGADIGALGASGAGTAGVYGRCGVGRLGRVAVPPTAPSEAGVTETGSVPAEIVITPPHTEHRARTPVAGTLAGSTRKTERQSGQETVMMTAHQIGGRCVHACFPNRS